MCFSATASFVAGSFLSVVGIVAVKKVKRPTEIPYASIPLLFAAQQIVEGVVWLSFEQNSSSVNAIATTLYTLFSHVLWPIYIPFAVLLLETVSWRKKILSALLVFGGALGLYFLYSILQSPIPVQVLNHSISYEVTELHFQVLALTYFMTTCGSCLVSSHKMVNLFGGLVFLSALMALWLYFMSFISVWCFFSALLSLIVLGFFTQNKRRKN